MPIISSKICHSNKPIATPEIRAEAQIELGEEPNFSVTRFQMEPKTEMVVRGSSRHASKKIEPDVQIHKKRKLSD